MKTVRIGGASGFWGDSDLGPRQLVEQADIDYLVFDYLAELTMSILSSARLRSPDRGYAADFIATMRAMLPQIRRKNIRVIANAGGLNPEGCVGALQAVADQQGLPLRIACVTGDELVDRLADFRSADVRDMGSGGPLPSELASANAYLGARAVTEALNAGADIVITGRCVDSALALGALAHEFGWSFDDYDKLASGSLVGHLLECGAQATGGLHTDWQEVDDWANIGYPIAECLSDGSFFITKPAGTGGLVNRAVVAEQMLYEIGDPAHYVLPDVICDFTEVSIEDVGPHRVKVSPARGHAPSGSYKVSCTFTDGYRVNVQLLIIGIDAVAKAERTAAALLERVRGMLRQRNLADFTETLVEVIGAESVYGPHSRRRDAREVQMRVAARHTHREALTLLAREVAQAGTSWSPGTTGAGKRAEPFQVVRLFSFLWPARDVDVSLDIDGNRISIPPPVGGGLSRSREHEPTPVPTLTLKDDFVEVPLIQLAWARSGDKGDISNVGVIARSPAALELMRQQLTSEVVSAYLAHLLKGPVRRYELPGIGGFNFVMEDALAGGGMASLRSDPLGKGMGQILLSLLVRVPADWPNRFSPTDT